MENEANNSAARATYHETHIALNDYMRASMQAMASLRSDCPMAECDVDEAVYESLEEERRYETDAMSIEDYVAELREVADKAPNGCEVVVEFERDYGYDDESITVRRIGYWREPTTEEREQREAHNREAREHNAALAKRQAEAAAERDRAEYERLKAKYEASDTPEQRVTIR